MASLNGVACALTVVNAAKLDVGHPLNYLASKVVVDQHFVDTLRVLHEQFAIFVDYFDGKHNWQVCFKNALWISEAQRYFIF